MNRKAEIMAYGIRVLLSNHPEIRRLKRNHKPSCYGNKLWTSSWLLMDFLKKKDLKKGAKVLEIGCGWGLTGIFCARNFGAKVQGVDIDPDVFPYLDLHAKINRVQMGRSKGALGGLTPEFLKGFDIIIGADICFWDSMVLPLKRLINRAFKSGVRKVLIADPCRSPFEEVSEYYVKKGKGEVLDWIAPKPRRIQGQILKIEQ